MKIMEICSNRTRISVFFENIGNIDKEIFISSVEELLKDIKIEPSFEIPYVAGYNKLFTMIYIDSSIPVYSKYLGTSFNIHKALAIHEIIEDCIERQFKHKVSYLPAHNIASKVEKDYVISLGVDFEKYKKMMDFYVKKCESKKLYTRVPNDLDLTPYLDNQTSEDVKILKRMGLDSYGNRI